MLRLTAKPCVSRVLSSSVGSSKARARSIAAWPNLSNCVPSALKPMLASNPNSLPPISPPARPPSTPPGPPPNRRGKPAPTAPAPKRFCAAVNVRCAASAFLLRCFSCSFNVLFTSFSALLSSRVWAARNLGLPTRVSLPRIGDRGAAVVFAALAIRS